MWAFFAFFLHFTSCGCVSIASSARRSFRGNIKSEGKDGGHQIALSLQEMESIELETLFRDTRMV